MTPSELMHAIDTQLAHVWMVRAFLKHSDEAADDDELANVHRDLYDYLLALGKPLSESDAAEYLKLAHKKFARLLRTTEAFCQLQPQISQHTNFQMAARSLAAAVGQIEQLLTAGSTGTP